MQNQEIINLINNYDVKRTIFINDFKNERYINSFTQHIYVINLETDRIRRNYIIKLMEKYNINFELIIVPKLNEYQYKCIGNTYISLGESGCYLSHMFCLNDAIINDYDNIIIFEDDIILHKNFHLLFENTVNQNNFDILMLGANDFHFSKINHEYVTNNLYKPDPKSVFLLGTHAIMYSKNGIKELFLNRLNSPTFMDNNLIEILNKFENTCYVSSPNLVVTDLSTTNLNHNFWITNELKENYYYKNCFNNELKFIDYNFIYLKPLELGEQIIFFKSYQETMHHILHLFFTSYTSNDNNSNDNNHYVDIVKLRLVYDFFNNQDLEFIILAKL
jgi:GR25 family glycosyltransferase involved in LPS biosynthesis